MLNYPVTIFLQPVVDAFDPRLLVSPSISHVIDFTKIKVLLYFFYAIYFLLFLIFRHTKGAFVFNEANYCFLIAYLFMRTCYSDHYILL